MEPALKTDNVFILVKRSAANGWYVCLGTEATQGRVLLSQTQERRIQDQRILDSQSSEMPVKIGGMEVVSFIKRTFGGTGEMAGWLEALTAGSRGEETQGVLGGETVVGMGQKSKNKLEKRALAALAESLGSAPSTTWQLTNCP